MLVTSISAQSLPLPQWKSERVHMQNLEKIFQSLERLGNSTADKAEY